MERPQEAVGEGMMDDRKELRAEPPAHLERLLRAVGGERKVLARLVTTFFEDYPEKLASIRAALQASDARAVERAAHSYRGALTLLGAGEACSLAARIEDLSAEGDLKEAGLLAPKLEKETERLAAFLAEEAGIPCAK